MTKLFFASFWLTCCLFVSTAAQNKTIILVRHAEKDASGTADKNDPVLTDAGKQRAERLSEVIKRYKPGAIYSTDYKRSRDTVAPIAAKRKKQIQIYDSRKPNDLVDAIMKSKTKRFLVVGHSNTIPGLANLLGRKELFKNLDDAEYGAIWIIRIRDGQVRKTEIIPY